VGKLNGEVCDGGRKMVEDRVFTDTDGRASCEQVRKLVIIAV